MSSLRNYNFSDSVIAWQKRYGRHNLPWQLNREPYRVLLAEVMLQQTQVQTVIPYFTRFVAKFPSIHALADAPLDSVISLWGGLGYYSRARNLHRCAQIVVDQHGGKLPPQARALQTLPGIGRSTAAAIASTCFAERVSILDGNARRLIARYLAFSGDLAIPGNQSALWECAEQLLPAVANQREMPTYTQGLMDLGAIICIRSNPKCEACPLQASCGALARGQVGQIPVRQSRIRRVSRSFKLLWWVRPDGAVWLERRDPAGIWGGLFSLPLFPSEDTVIHSVPEHLIDMTENMQPLVHKLTHLDMHLHPIRIKLRESVSPSSKGQWHALSEWNALGLPAPVRKLLNANH